jgi:hypothetical protein
MDSDPGKRWLQSAQWAAPKHRTGDRIPWADKSQSGQRAVGHGTLIVGELDHCPAGAEKAQNRCLKNLAAWGLGPAIFGAAIPPALTHVRVGATHC